MLENVKPQVRIKDREPVRINLPRVEITGFDFSVAEDRETVARLLEAMGLHASFTVWKMLEIINQKLEDEDVSTMKIPDLGKAIQSISTSASINFEKAGLVRTGVEQLGDKTNVEEHYSPEYIRALKNALDVLERKAG